MGMLGDQLNEMNLSRNQSLSSKLQSDVNQIRDRSSKCVGSYPESGELQLWRCYGASGNPYELVCGVRAAMGQNQPQCWFDAHSYHYALVRQDHAVGGMTITRPDDGEVDCEAFYPQPLLEVFREDLLTSCRFAMLPTANTGYSLLRWMTTAVWQDQVSLGCRAGLINSQRHMTPFYRRMGFRPLDGFSFVHPALGTASQVMTLRADPDEQPYFREAFEQLSAVIPVRVWERVLSLSMRWAQQQKNPPKVGRIFSFAAGSNSTDPHGYRVVSESDSSRIDEVCRLFPQLTQYFSAATMVLVAYPAPLGLISPGILVDTYLHPPTFCRAMHLAAIEERPVVVVAQPVVGADMLLRAVNSGNPLPAKILWASGGYYLPESLERFIRNQLKAAGCELAVLHCYGTAEIGHSLFVAIDRLASGRPRFLKAAANVSVEADDRNGRLTLTTSSGTKHVLEDEVRVEDEGFDIIPHSQRLSQSILQTLESWSDPQWRRWTGFAIKTPNELFVQCRESINVEPDSNSDNLHELEYHHFFAKFGGSNLTKPRWNDQATANAAERLFVSPQSSESEPTAGMQ